MNDIPSYGFGLGLRAPHYDEVLRDKPALGWFEIISENYISAHAGYWDYLSQLRADYPIFMHGVSLSIGSVEPLDMDYLHKLKKLADAIEAPIVSDHLCYTGAAGKNTHDLLPIPYTEEALAHLIPRIHTLQETLGRAFVFENASTYLEFKGSTLTEPEFFRELCARTGCGILLDVNNVHVSATNHGWDAKEYIDAMPTDSIMQYHIAGHTDKGTHLIDTHNKHVTEAVWELFRHTIARHGERSTMIEWDAEIPAFPVLMAELDKARAIANTAKRKAA